MATKVILIDAVPNLGLPGDVVQVKPGYARNYLIPQGKALRATEGNVAEMEHQRRIAESRRRKLIDALTDVRDLVQGQAVSFTEKVSETGRLYGSVTARRIGEALAEKISQVEATWVRLAEPIKAPGVYEVQLELAPQLIATVSVEVIGEGVPEPEPEPEPDEDAVEAAGDAEDVDEYFPGSEALKAEEQASGEEEEESGA